MIVALPLFVFPVLRGLRGTRETWQLRCQAAVLMLSMVTPGGSAAARSRSAWLTAGDLKERSSRGGSFHTGDLDFVRCSARGGETPDYRDFETGFRVLAEKR